MREPDLMSTLKLCLVCDEDLVAAAVRASCPPPHHLQVFSRQDLVNPQHTISDHGRAIVEAAASADAVLLDWAFEEAPALNTLCYHVRRGLHAPVLMLCREGPEAMAACLAAGADDVLTFPIYLPYLQAKILSYRRLVQAARTEDSGSASASAGATGPKAARDVRRFGALRLDLSAHRFYIRDEVVELTPREFALLVYLVENGEMLCTRDQILDGVWNINFDTGTNMVDVYMYFLRKKLEAHGLQGMIQTVRGHGYRLVSIAPSD